MAGETTIAELEKENKRLKLAKENAQLKADLEAMKVPWWRKLPWVASFTAILAAIVPATTAVDGCFRNSRELALAEKKQAHELALAESKQAYEIQLSYFKNYQEPGERQRTLRFVLATARDESVQKWAAKELGLVGAELKLIDDQMSDLKEKVSDPNLPVEERTKAQEELLRLEALRQREASARDPDDMFRTFMKRKGQARASAQDGPV